MSRNPDPTPRRRVDLRQYVLALGVTAVVVVAAWLVGGDESVPGWASGLLVPALGWLALAIVAGALAVRLLGRRGDR